MNNELKRVTLYTQYWAIQMASNLNCAICDTEYNKPWIEHARGNLQRLLNNFKRIEDILSKEQENA